MQIVTPEGSSKLANITKVIEIAGFLATPEGEAAFQAMTPEVALMHVNSIGSMLLAAPTREIEDHIGIVTTGKRRFLEYIPLGYMYDCKSALVSMGLKTAQKISNKTHRGAFAYYYTLAMHDLYDANGRRARYLYLLLSNEASIISAEEELSYYLSTGYYDNEETPRSQFQKNYLMSPETFMEYLYYKIMKLWCKNTYLQEHNVEAISVVNMPSLDIDFNNTDNTYTPIHMLYQGTGTNYPNSIGSILFAQFIFDIKRFHRFYDCSYLIKDKDGNSRLVIDGNEVLKRIQPMDRDAIAKLDLALKNQHLSLIAETFLQPNSYTILANGVTTTLADKVDMKNGPFSKS